MHLGVLAARVEIGMPGIQASAKIAEAVFTEQKGVGRVPRPTP
jgi:hypothetical protein